MYVCICKSVTDSQIRKCVRDKGVRNLRGLRRELGACDQCGKCAPEARQLISECVDETRHHDRHLLTAA
ncbi:bacterioferritin-associated ferredoxin [Methyloparacoccus murrellii]|jgi:bacterioferritin-associated ferredoxin